MGRLLSRAEESEALPVTSEATSSARVRASRASGLGNPNRQETVAVLLGAMPHDAREPRARLDKTTSASRPLGARAPGWPRAWPARPRAGTIKSRLVQWPIASRTLARLKGGCSGGMRAAFPPRGALIALWIQAVPGCCHAEILVRPPLTWGVHGHRRHVWPLRLRPSHLGRTQWPSTTIAAVTAAVLSSGCRWGRPWRLWRARAAVGTPGGSSPCR